LLKAQFIGSAIITVSTFAVALSLMYLVNLTGTLRVSEEGELYGLDLHEHGISAYPEYVISSLAAPAGMPKDIRGPILAPDARAVSRVPSLGD
jgi:Amt family ammonium transporter